MAQNKQNSMNKCCTECRRLNSKTRIASGEEQYICTDEDCQCHKANSSLENLERSPRIVYT
jgi:hypothetical protein